MHSSVRRRFNWWRRHPDRVHWLVVGVLTTVVALLMVSAEGRSRRAVAAWGETVPVVRALSPLEAGVDVPAGAVELMAAPRALVPVGALDTLDQVSAPSRAVPSGAIVTRLDIMAPSAAPLSGRAIAIPVPRHQPIPAPGARIELVLSTHVDPYGDTGTPTQLVPAVVLQSNEEVWLVEVEERYAITVATATISGTLVPLMLSR